MDEPQQPRIWDVASAEEAAKWSLLVKEFNHALDACRRELKREQELDATRQEIEALPTTPTVEQ